MGVDFRVCVWRLEQRGWAWISGFVCGGWNRGGEPGFMGPPVYLAPMATVVLFTLGEVFELLVLTHRYGILRPGLHSDPSERLSQSDAFRELCCDEADPVCSDLLEWPLEMVLGRNEPCARGL